MLAAAPISAAPVIVGPADAAGGDRESRDAALTCLATAIGYEAGHESQLGQQAVAQVVLNREHHPAFPKSICAVIYQGATRRTGCQFTFACDGSLARRLSAQTWANAKAVAAQALDSRLPETIGAATHYHADYVLPRWAPALVRVGAIGAHIFYRFPGKGGAALPRLANDGRRPPAEAFRPWGLAPLS